MIALENHISDSERFLYKCSSLETTQTIVCTDPTNLLRGYPLFNQPSLTWSNIDIARALDHASCVGMYGIYTCCTWAGGSTEFSSIIDQICWSCAFFLTYHVCLGIFDQICWAFAFFSLKPFPAWREKKIGEISRKW